MRNRSKEIVELLSDVEKIRVERRKAKTNKHKYIGTGNDGLSFNSGGGRYGGFGSEALGGGYSGSASYGNSGSSPSFSLLNPSNNSADYGGGGSASSSSFRDDNRRGGFEEYTAGDDETVSSPPVRSGSMRSATSSVRTPVRKPSVPPPAPAPVPVVDLLGGLDDDTFSSAPAPPPASAPPSFATNKALPTPANVLDGM